MAETSRRAARGVTPSLQEAMGAKRPRDISNERRRSSRARSPERRGARTTDDMVLFDEDPGVLNGWYVQMDEFLKSKLRLHLHPHKKHVNRAESGIDFTGFIIKPGRTYLRQTSLSGCRRTVRAWEREGSPVDPETLERVSQSLNSYLGMLRQVNGYKARKGLCCRVENLFLRADAEYTKIRAVLR